METTLALVLRTLKYNDRLLVADLYTELRGRLSVLVALPRGGGGRRTGAHASLFRPLALLEVQLGGRPGARLPRVGEARACPPLPSLAADPPKSSVALFLAEFLCRALRLPEADAPLFAYLRASVCWLDACPSSRVANFHLVFLFGLSRFLGLSPNLDSCRPGHCFDLREGCFLPPSQACGRPHALSASESALLPLLARLRFPTMHLLTLSREQRLRCLSLLVEFYRLHLPDFPPLRSMEVLREVFE